MQKADSNKKKTPKIAYQNPLSHSLHLRLHEKMLKSLSKSYTNMSKENATNATNKQVKKFLLTLLKKLLRDLLSLKMWILGITTGLLVSRLIDSSTWATVIVALLGMREFSEYRNNVYGEKTSE